MHFYTHVKVLTWYLQNNLGKLIPALRHLWKYIYVLFSKLDVPQCMHVYTVQSVVQPIIRTLG